MSEDNPAERPVEDKQPVSLKTAALKGEMHDAKEQIISAQEIQDLMWGKTIGKLSNDRVIAVRIKNAYIDGILNLKDLRGPGGEYAPPLELVNCQIPEEIDLSFAKIKNLSLKKCKFRSLVGHGMQIEGDVDITEVSSYEELTPKEKYSNKNEVVKKNGVDGQGVCYVILSDTIIRGDLSANKARFSLPSNLPDSGRNPYAFDIHSSIINGKMYFENGFANGGMSVQDTTVDKDVWIGGSKLIAQKEDAFKGQSLKLGGSLMLNSLGVDIHQRTIFSGPVRLLHAKISNNIHMSGVRILKGKKSQHLYSITLSHAQIGSDIIMRPILQEDMLLPFKAKGFLEFFETYVAGKIKMESAELMPISQDYILAAEGLETGKNLEIIGTKDHPFKSQGQIHLNNATIGGNLEVHNAELNSYIMYEGFFANDITVGGNVDFRPDLYCPVEFNRATVKGRFILGEDNKEPITCYMSSQEEPKISLRGAKIGDALMVRDFRVMKAPTEFFHETGQTWLLKDDFNTLNHKLEKIDEYYPQFLPGWRLVHFNFKKSNKKNSISCLIKNDEVKILDGGSSVINALIRQEAFLIDKSNVLDYLKFFCAYVWGHNHPFYILDENFGGDYFCNKVGKVTDKERKKISNLKAAQQLQYKSNKHKEKKGWYSVKATGVFNKELYRLTFEVGPYGQIVLVDDKKLGPDQEYPKLTSQDFNIDISSHCYNISVFPNGKKQPAGRLDRLVTSLIQFVKKSWDKIKKLLQKRGKSAGSVMKKADCSLGVNCPYHYRCLFTAQPGGTIEKCRLLKQLTTQFEKDYAYPKPNKEESGRAIERYPEDQFVHYTWTANQGSRVDIDLTRAETGALNDQSGHAWGDRVRLFLDGFTYNHLSRPEWRPMDHVFNRLSSFGGCQAVKVRRERLLMKYLLIFEKYYPQLDFEKCYAQLNLAKVPWFLREILAKLLPRFKKCKKKLLNPERSYSFEVALVYYIVATPLVFLFMIMKERLKKLVKIGKRFFYSEKNLEAPKVIGENTEIALRRIQSALGYENPDPGTVANVFWYYLPPWRNRVRWLMLQYRYYYPTGIDFSPQPYRQLERVYAAQGQHEDARRIALWRLRLERENKPWCIRLLLWPYQKFFGFGLSPGRAFVFLLFWLFLGFAGVQYLNDSDMLMVDSIPSATVAIETIDEDEKNKEKVLPARSLGTPQVVLQSEAQQGGKKPENTTPPASSKPSGQENSSPSKVQSPDHLTAVACDNIINPWVYALDVMVPLIDFRQEFRCHIRSINDKNDDQLKRTGQYLLAHLGFDCYSQYRSAQYPGSNFWLYLKAIYTALGWLITTFAFLTISGILRRQVEGPNKLEM